MKLNLASGLVLALATVEAVGAHSWFSKAGIQPSICFPKTKGYADKRSTVVYDKWHETELERWLTDHGTTCLREMS